MASHIWISKSTEAKAEVLYHWFTQNTKVDTVVGESTLYAQTFGGYYLEAERQGSHRPNLESVRSSKWRYTRGKNIENYRKMWAQHLQFMKIIHYERANLELEAPWQAVVDKLNEEGNSLMMTADYGEIDLAKELALMYEGVSEEDCTYLPTNKVRAKPRIVTPEQQELLNQIYIHVRERVETDPGVFVFHNYMVHPTMSQVRKGDSWYRRLEENETVQETGWRGRITNLGGHRYVYTELSARLQEMRDNGE